MKKLLALLLALAMIVALATACNKPADDNPDNPPDGPDNPDNPPDGPDNPDNPDGLGYTITEFDPNATYTQRVALTTLYSNWNPHNYKDGNAISLFNPLADNLYTLSWNDELHNPDNLEPWTAYAIIPQMAADCGRDRGGQGRASRLDPRERHRGLRLGHSSP